MKNAESLEFTAVLTALVMFTMGFSVSSTGDRRVVVLLPMMTLP